MKSLTLIIALSYLLNLPLSFAEQQTDIDAKTVEYSQAELEQMLAPIALYPDSVLTHILIAATYPLEVIEAERWLSKNPNLSNNDLIDKGEEMEWDPSVVALLPFADILTKMSDELTWTRSLGDAFLSDEELVLASIQSLRQKADNAGSLAQMENVDVDREANNIAIAPADPQIVYVPYYDARVVYGPWYWSGYPPVYWAHYPSYYSPQYYSAYPAPFYWHSAVHISVGWFFGGFHWGNHHVVVNHHPHSYYYRHYNRHNNHYSDGKKHYSSGQSHTAKQSSKGYQRWQHQPSHRKSISYKNDRVAKQYSSNKPSKNQVNISRKQDRKLLALTKYNGSQNSISKKTLKTNKITSTRHKQISQKLDKSSVPNNGYKITSTRHKQISQKLDKSSVRNNGYKQSNKVITNNSSNRASNVNATSSKADIKKPYNAQSKKQYLPSSSNQNMQVSSKSTYTAAKSNNNQSTKQYKQKASKPSYSSPKQHSRSNRDASHKSSRTKSVRPKH